MGGIESLIPTVGPFAAFAFLLAIVLRYWNQDHRSLRAALTLEEKRRRDEIRDHAETRRLLDAEIKTRRSAEEREAREAATVRRLEDRIRRLEGQVRQLREDITT